MTPAGKTFASPFALGATWFVGLDYANALSLIDEYHEGDICLTNDPYSGFVCTHSPDMHLWKPVFHEGELLSAARLLDQHPHRRGRAPRADDGGPRLRAVHARSEHPAQRGARAPKPELVFEAGEERRAAPERRIPIYAGSAHRDALLFLRHRLHPGDRIEGPAVVAQEDATVCVPAGFSGRVDGYRNLLLHRARDYPGFLTTEALQ